MKLLEKEKILHDLVGRTLPIHMYGVERDLDIWEIEELKRAARDYGVKRCGYCDVWRYDTDLDEKDICRDCRYSS